MLNLLFFFCCYLSGLFFGVMFFTIIENVSKGFRQFIRKMCFRIPFYYRRIIMWVMLVITAFAGYTYLPFGITVKGLIAGAVGGIFMYFKAGVTMGNPTDPKKSAKTEQQRVPKLNNKKRKK